MQRKEEVVENDDDYEDDMWFFVDEELKSIESSKFNSIESRQSIRSASIEHLEMDDKLKEVDRSDSNITG